MKIKLKDNTILEVPDKSNVLDVAKQIGERLAMKAVGGIIDGVVCGLSDIVPKNSSIIILTLNDKEGINIYRNTASHILAHAVKNVFPEAMLASGSFIRNGFYYDFDFPTTVNKDILKTIEAEMNLIIKADFPITQESISKTLAKRKFKAKNEIYKLKMLEEIEKGNTINIFQHGNFFDFCEGPFLLNTGKLKNFKLTQITGAYWKGNKNNKMLTRIYGAAFETYAELQKYLNEIEEAKNRDHNKLGRELGFFMTDENVGQGLPLIMPKGAEVIRTLIRFVEDEEEKRGYLPTRTPLLAKSDLYKISGHWDHYKDDMFIIGDSVLTEDVFALRPMTCPFQYLIYKNGIKSYRDLPIKYSETSTLFRNENSGEMHGLIRLRQFTLSDAHIILRQEQIKPVFKEVMELIYYLLDSIKLREDVTFRFSKWDPKNKEKYLYKPDIWEQSQNILQEILDDLGVDYYVAEGEAAFYGPKLDVQICNVWGKEDTIITAQLDFALAERFGLEYIAEDGSKKTPVIIHRSSIGCYERTLALLIEKFKGALPVWLSPIQVVVMSINDRNIETVMNFANLLKQNGIKAIVDIRTEKIGNKIRKAQLEKIPIMALIGDNEMQNQKVSLRERKNGDKGVYSYDEFINYVLNIIKNKE